MNPPKIKTGKKTKNLEGLTELWIEVLKDCNKHCIFCFQSAGGIVEEEGTLKIEEYVSILTQAKEIGVTTIGIPGAGEPFYGRNIELTRKIIQFCTQNNMQTVIFTAGDNLDDKLIEELNQPNISLMIKYNSTKPKLQDKLVGLRSYTIARKLNLKKLMNAGFNKYDENKNSRLGLVTSVMTENYEEIPEIFRYCRDNQIIPDFDPLMLKGKGATCGLCENDEKTKNMFETLQKIDKEEYGFEWLLSPTYIAGNCERYKQHLYIDRFGNVSPCLGANLNEIKLGNLKEKSLKALWNLSLMKKIRNRDYTGECINCESFKKEECNSCLGRYADKISEDEVHTIGCWNKK